MSVPRLCILSLLAFSASAAAAAQAEPPAPTRLRCEYRANPLGIDAAPPRLSWILDVEQRGLRQSAYQIVVASTPEHLAADTGDLWDSGKVVSEETVNVAYAGAPLASGQRCYWKARFWDKNDQASLWSEPAQWSMGLLVPADWQGKYIGADPGAESAECPRLRTTFELKDRPGSAFAYINALGYYELYVNGQKVDDYVLSPAVSQFDRRSLYITHDIAPHLRPGDNCIALWLGAGWYAEGLPGVVHNGPLVRAEVKITRLDGVLETLFTDEAWKVAGSACFRIGNWKSGQYGGERVDARLDETDWTAAGYDDSAWAKAFVADVPDHTVAAQPCEPNRVQRRYEPALVRFEGDGQWLLDFGTNLTGLFEMTFHKLAPGREITLEYGDRLEDRELDSFSQQDVYIARGGDAETFRNRFNYHAFRYVRIHGMDAAPEVNDAAAYLVHTDYPVNASFACSDPTLTRVHDMVQYTLRCLSLGGYLVDCPHIERLGYGGDGQASTPTAMTMFGMGPLYRGWLAHWRDCQRPDGGMPHTAPNPYPAGGGPYWCGFIIAASWEQYVQYRDESVLSENYPAMQQWLDGYVETYCENDLLGRWPDTDYRTWYLGDWARPHRNEKEAERSVFLVNNCFRIQCYDWMAAIADVLGKAEDAARYAATAERLRPIVHKAFYDPDRQTYADDTQLDLAYPLLVGVTPEGLRPAVLQRLADDILVKREGHLDVGLVGVPLLTETLMELDRNDLVAAYTGQETFPGWGYMLANGATTTWEHWDAHRSHIHNCYNGIGVWFYRGLAGIRPDAAAPGYKHFTLQPALVPGVSWVTCRQDTLRGPIESAWRLADEQFQWDIRVPANSTATVYVPAADPGPVLESGKPIDGAGDVRPLPAVDGYAVFELQSGRYAFSAPVPAS